jgi:hypothetical protein
MHGVTMKFKDKVVAAHTMKTYVRMKVQFHSFLAWMLSGREWSASHPDCFTYGKIAAKELLIH